MIPSVESQIRKLDQDLTQLLRELKEYSEPHLNRKPSENAWSVLQVMHHLMLAEDLSLKYIQKKISYPETLKKKGVLSSFRKTFLSLSLKVPMKFKAPEMVDVANLPVESSFWETAKLWKTRREELSAYLESLDAELFSKEIYKHPYAGRMDISGMVQFYQNHFDRHRKQIRRILHNYAMQPIEL